MEVVVYDTITREQGIDWLIRNDGEHDWGSECAGMSKEDVIATVGDNLQDFGTKTQADGLKLRFLHDDHYDDL
ncbi:hypothetical protein ACTG16_22585 [Aeromonas sp. 23P]|uniref:hypothetical protein n=1 Tax=Aeromonas sp. 23P TaxID=3452716 RepID=UPI003F79E85A|nr:hypothetical protein [Aeromonas veronii]